MRARSLGCMPAVAVLLAGCGLTHDSASAISPPAPTVTRQTSTNSAAPTTTSTVRSRTPRGALLRFARAYAQYLEGRRAAGQIDDLTRTAAGQLGPRIPADKRHGRVRVTSVTAVGLGSDSEVRLRDGPRTLPIEVRIIRSGGHDVVVGVVAPDLDSLLQAPSEPVVAPPGSAPAKRAANAFLAGYIPWVYGHGTASAIGAIAASLARQLQGRSLPQVRGAPNVHPQVAAIGMQRAGAGWSAQANITDAQRTYDLTLTVVCRHGIWEVSRVQEPS